MTTRERAKSAPDLPTVIETGVPGFEVTSWFGVTVPAKTPPEIVARLHREARQISESAEFRKAMEAIGGEPLEPMTASQFGDYIRAELARHAAVAKAVGLVPK